ncbi:hypothetical protein U9M48_007587 [Paspalum notatum var. saurae]|uniref:Uncharacterized protein n=1 Tax=Paspalum notatum var. saurae TaxID=547442 RepID=A0AAQ3SMJ7_PASNO
MSNTTQDRISDNTDSVLLFSGNGGCGDNREDPLHLVLSGQTRAEVAVEAGMQRVTRRGVRIRC